MKNSEIELVHGNGRRLVVVAEIVGDLALHGSERSGFAVTHVPTKTSLSGAIPTAVKKRAAVLAWMAAVQKKLRKDWTEMRKASHAEIATDPERSRAIRDRIRKVCEETIP